MLFVTREEPKPLLWTGCVGVLGRRSNSCKHSQISDLSDFSLIFNKYQENHSVTDWLFNSGILSICFSLSDIPITSLFHQLCCYHMWQKRRGRSVPHGTGGVDMDAVIAIAWCERPMPAARPPSVYRHAEPAIKLYSVRCSSVIWNYKFRTHLIG
jgi:hypothetical protein